MATTRTHSSSFSSSEIYSAISSALLAGAGAAGAPLADGSDAASLEAVEGSTNARSTTTPTTTTKKKKRGRGVADTAVASPMPLLSDGYAESLRSGANPKTAEEKRKRKTYPIGGVESEAVGSVCKKQTLSCGGGDSAATAPTPISTDTPTPGQTATIATADCRPPSPSSPPPPPPSSPPPSQPPRRMVMTAAALRDTFNAIAGGGGLLLRFTRDGAGLYADTITYACSNLKPKPADASACADGPSTNGGDGSCNDAYGANEGGGGVGYNGCDNNDGYEGAKEGGCIMPDEDSAVVGALSHCTVSGEGEGGCEDYAGEQCAEAVEGESSSASPLFQKKKKKKGVCSASYSAKVAACVGAAVGARLRCLAIGSMGSAPSDGVREGLAERRAKMAAARSALAAAAAAAAAAANSSPSDFSSSLAAADGSSSAVAGGVGGVPLPSLDSTTSVGCMKGSVSHHLPPFGGLVGPKPNQRLITCGSDHPTPCGRYNMHQGTAKQPAKNEGNSDGPVAAADSALSDRSNSHCESGGEDVVDANAHGDESPQPQKARRPRFGSREYSGEEINGCVSELVRNNNNNHVAAAIAGECGASSSALASSQLPLKTDVISSAPDTSSPSSASALVVVPPSPPTAQAPLCPIAAQGPLARAYYSAATAAASCASSEAEEKKCGGGDQPLVRCGAPHKAKNGNNGDGTSATDASNTANATNSDALMARVLSTVRSRIALASDATTLRSQLGGGFGSALPFPSPSAGLSGHHLNPQTLALHAKHLNRQRQREEGREEKARAAASAADKCGGELLLLPPSTATAAAGEGKPSANSTIAKLGAAGGGGGGEGSAEGFTHVLRWRIQSHAAPAAAASSSSPLADANNNGGDYFDLVIGGDLPVIAAAPVTPSPTSVAVAQRPKQRQQRRGAEAERAPIPRDEAVRPYSSVGRQQQQPPASPTASHWSHSNRPSGPPSPSLSAASTNASADPPRMADVVTYDDVDAIVRGHIGGLQQQMVALHHRGLHNSNNINPSSSSLMALTTAAAAAGSPLRHNYYCQPHPLAAPSTLGLRAAAVASAAAAAAAVGSASSSSSDLHQRLVRLFTTGDTTVMGAAGGGQHSRGHFGGAISQQQQLPLLLGSPAAVAAAAGCDGAHSDSDVEGDDDSATLRTTSVDFDGEFNYDADTKEGKGRGEKEQGGECMGISVGKPSTVLLALRRVAADGRAVGSSSPQPPQQLAIEAGSGGYSDPTAVTSSSSAAAEATHASASSSSNPPASHTPTPTSTTSAAPPPPVGVVDLPLQPSEALALWFDALVASAAHVAIICHDVDGVVQRLEVVGSGDLLSAVPGGVAAAHDAVGAMQQVLRWVVAECAADGEYILFRRSGCADFEIYEILPNTNANGCLGEDGGGSVSGAAAAGRSSASSLPK